MDQCFVRSGGASKVAGAFEAQVVQLDQALADTERHAAAVLSRIRGLRKRVATGDFSVAHSQMEGVPRLIEQVAGAVEGCRAALTYDTAAALANGEYLDELKAEASAQDVVLVERDGRVTAFPLLLKLEPKAAAIRVGRALERRLRPSLVIKLLKRAQGDTRFDAERFLNRLFGAYAYLAPVAEPGWTAGQAGPGPVVALADVHALLTQLPVAAADYPREEFACDLLRLDRAPDTRTRGGHGFSLPASTGSKGRNRLTVFDEQGEERVFVGLRFLGASAGEPHADRP